MEQSEYNYFATEMSTFTAANRKDINEAMPLLFNEKEKKANVQYKKRPSKTSHQDLLPTKWYCQQGLKFQIKLK